MDFLPTPSHIWKDVTEPADVERILLHQNKWHLQQVDIEGGISCGQTMKKVKSEFGLSGICDKLIAGEDMTYMEMPEEMIDWFNRNQGKSVLSKIWPVP